MNLKLEIDGIEKFNWAFDTLGKTLSDWRPVWPEIEQVFYRIELEQFNSEGARGGQRWQALSPAYRQWKEKHFPGRPILVRTGTLKRSLTVIGTTGSESIRESDEMSLTLGSRVPYAIYHQRGTSRMPARPPMQIQRNDMGKIVSRMWRFAERGARDAGFQTQSRLQTVGEAS